MIGMVYVKLLEITNPPRKNPYSKIREWKLYVQECRSERKRKKFQRK